MPPRNLDHAAAITLTFSQFTYSWGNALGEKFAC